LFELRVDSADDIVRIATFLTTSLVVTALITKRKRAEEDLGNSNVRLEAAQHIAHVSSARGGGCSRGRAPCRHDDLFEGDRKVRRGRRLRIDENNVVMGIAPPSKRGQEAACIPADAAPIRPGSAINADIQPSAYLHSLPVSGITYRATALAGGYCLHPGDTPNTPLKADTAGTIRCKESLRLPP